MWLLHIFNQWQKTSFLNASVRKKHHHFHPSSSISLHTPASVQTTPARQLRTKLSVVLWQWTHRMRRSWAPVQRCHRPPDLSLERVEARAPPVGDPRTRLPSYQQMVERLRKYGGSICCSYPKRADFLLPAGFLSHQRLVSGRSEPWCRAGQPPARSCEALSHTSRYWRTALDWTWKWRTAVSLNFGSLATRSNSRWEGDDEFDRLRGSRSVTKSSVQGASMKACVCSGGDSIGQTLQKSCLCADSRPNFGFQALADRDKNQYSTHCHRS